MTELINAENIMQLISCLLTGWINFSFMDSLFERKYKINYISFYILLTTFKFLTVLLDNVLLNYISTVIYFIILCTLLYESCTSNIYTMTFIFIIFLFLAEAVSIFFVSFLFMAFEIKNTEIMQLFLGILSFSLFLLLYKIIIHLYKSKFMKNTLSSYISRIELLFLTVSSILIFVFTLSNNLITNNNIQLLILIVCVLLLLFNFYILSIFDKKIQHRILTKDYENSKMLYTYTLKRYEMLLDNIKIEKKLLHDVNSHIDMIEHLYSTNQIEKAKKYQDRFRENLENNSIIFSLNPILQIMLLELYDECNAKRVTFKYNIDKRVDFSFINDFDLVTIFSNLIQNSLEALEEVDDNKYINISIRLVNQSIAILFTNSYHKVDKINDNFISTKKNHSGFGLNIISDACKIYSGFSEITTTDNEFNIYLIIPLQERGADDL